MDEKEKKLQDTLNMIDLDETGVLPGTDEVFQGEVSVDTMLLTDISESVAELEMYEDKDYTGEKPAEETATLEMINIDTQSLSQVTDVYADEDADSGEIMQDTDVSGYPDETGSEAVSGDVPEAGAETATIEYLDDIDEEDMLEQTSDISGEELIDIEKIVKAGKKKKAESAGKKEPVKAGPKRDKQGSQSTANGRDKKKKKAGIRVNRKVVIPVVAAVALICIAAVILLFGKNKSTPGTAVDMYAAGESLREIGNAGEGALIAVADARLAAQIAEAEKEEEEAEEEKDHRIDVSFTSVEQDLKIKFVDSESKRLSGGHEFEVRLKGVKNGEELEFKDDDMDGIIYKTGLKPGDYNVEVVKIPGISIGATANIVTIKEHIEYKKIEIKEEIKTEKEVNVAVEDTGGKNDEAATDPAGEAENTEQDTVEWVESSKTEVEGSGGYEVIGKDKLPAPSYSSRIDHELNYLAATYHSDTSVEPVSTPTPMPDNGESIPEEPTATPTEAASPTPSEETVATPTPMPDGEQVTDETATPTPTPAPTGETTATPTPAEGTEPAGGDDQKDPSRDKKTKLKDKDGRQVYIKDAAGKYIEAVYADYFGEAELYVFNEPEYKYTGWQTLNGNTYYYDKEGRPVSGDQVIKGVKYNFSAEGILIQDKNASLGIDVSKWNGAINWSEVANSGVKYVIIRCGYRGSSTGVLVEDSLFKSNIAAAKSAGLKVGVYFFTQAVNEVEAVEEASMCLELAKSYGLSYPVFLDVEYTSGKNGRADGLKSPERTAVARAFCETIRNGGLQAGVYSSKTWFENMLDYGSLSAYKIWLAHYTSKTDFPNRYDLWQYSSKGSVSGIKGAVDMNYSYLGY